MRKHKYLEDSGIKRSDIMSNICEENGSEPRSHKWKLQRKIYGFDDRETWSMDISFAQWLMERLLMYKDVTILDIDTSKSSYKGKIITKREAIDLMIESCKGYLIEGFDGENSAEYWKTITTLWADWGPTMWW